MSGGQRLTIPTKEGRNYTKSEILIAPGAEPLDPKPLVRLAHAPAINRAGEGMR